MSTDAEASGEPGPPIQPEVTMLEKEKPQEDVGPSTIEAVHPVVGNETRRLPVETKVPDESMSSVQSGDAQQTLSKACEPQPDRSTGDSSRSGDDMSTDSQSNASADSTSQLESQSTEKERTPSPVLGIPPCDISTGVSEHEASCDQSSVVQETRSSTLKDPDSSETSDSPPGGSSTPYSSTLHLDDPSTERQESESDVKDPRDLVSEETKLDSYGKKNLAPSQSVPDEESQGGCDQEGESESSEDVPVRPALVAARDGTKSDHQDLTPSLPVTNEESPGSCGFESATESSEDVRVRTELVAGNDRTKGENQDHTPLQPVSDEESPGDYDLECESESSDDAPVPTKVHSQDRAPPQPASDERGPGDYDLECESESSENPQVQTELVATRDRTTSDHQAGDFESTTEPSDNAGSDRTESENQDQAPPQPVSEKESGGNYDLECESESSGVPRVQVARLSNEEPQQRPSAEPPSPTTLQNHSNKADNSNSPKNAAETVANVDPTGQSSDVTANRPELTRTDSWLGSIMGDSTIVSAPSKAEGRPEMARSDSWLGSIMGESNAEKSAENNELPEESRPVVARSDSWLGSILGEPTEDEPTPQLDTSADRPGLARSDSWLGSIMGESNDEPAVREDISTEKDRPVLGRSDSWLGSIMGETADETTPKTNKSQAERPEIVRSDSWLGSIMGESNGDEPGNKNESTDDRPVVARSDSWLGSIMGESNDDPASKDENAQAEDRRPEIARSDSWLGSILGEPNDESNENQDTPGHIKQENADTSPTENRECSDSVGKSDTEQPKSWLESVFGEGENSGEACANPEAPKPQPDRRAGLQRSNSWLESVLAEGGDPTAADFKEQDEDRRGQLKKSKSWLEMMMNEEAEQADEVAEAKVDDDDKSSDTNSPATSNLRAELKRSQSWFESKEVTTAIESNESEAEKNVSDGLFYHEAEPEADATVGGGDDAGVCLSRFDGLRRLALFKALDSQSFLQAPETVLKAAGTERDRDGDKRLAIAKAILGEEIDRIDEDCWTDEGITLDLEVPDYLHGKDGNPKSAEAQQDPQATSEVEMQTKPSKDSSLEEDEIDETSGRQRWRKWFAGPKPKEAQEELTPVDVEDDQLESSASEVSESDPSLSTGMLEPETMITESKAPEREQETEAQKDEIDAADSNDSRENLEKNGIGKVEHSIEEESSLDATAALIQTLTPEEVDLITKEVVSQLQQEKEGATAESPAIPSTNSKRRRKKGSIGALLEQIPSTGKTGRHGDEVSVGVMNLRRNPVRSNRDVIVPNLDENTLVTSVKKHPWENALKETSKKSAFSHSNPDEEEELEKIEILGKADEFFGLRPNLSASQLPALTEEEESTRNSEESDVEEEEEESEEGVDELALLNEKSDLEIALEQEPEPAADFDEMWDNVSCDEEIANEFERKKRKKNHEREKRRQKIEREKDDSSVASRRLRLFEKTDRSGAQKHPKNCKTTKLSEELVEALQKVFDDGSENSLGSCSDEDDSEDMLGGSGLNASCNSLYLEENDGSESLPDYDPSESKAEEQDENVNQEIRRSDGRSKPMINKALSEDDPEEAMHTTQNNPGKAKKQSRKLSKTAAKKRTKRTETDASEVFMREISKLKQPKVLTIESLRQEMIDRRGTTVNLLKKEYVTFRKKRNDRKDVSGEEDDQVRPLDFGAIATRRSIAHTPADDIFGSTPKPKEESIGLAEKLSRWASEEGVSELDDLATVNENPTTVTNMFGVVQQTSNKTPSLAPPLRVPATPGGGPRPYVGGGPAAGSPAKTLRDAPMRPAPSAKSMSPSPVTYNKPSVRRDTRREPPPSSSGSVASSKDRIDMFATFGGAESSVLPSMNDDGSEEDFGLLAKSGDRDDDDDQSYFSTGSRKKKGFQKGLGKNLKKLAAKMPTMRTRGRTSGAGMMLSDNDW